jgi:hypothetical protein
MERDRALSFTPVDHPDERVQRVGFDLTDPYVEQCWSAVVGPSSTLLLRRLPALWVAQVPAEIGASDLSRSLGLGVGAGERSRLANTLNRLVQFGLARPAPDDAGLDVFRKVAPLSSRQLARVPEWTHATHERMFGTHLEQLGESGRRRSNVASIGARLDRLQHATPVAARSPDALGQALG